MLKSVVSAFLILLIVGPDDCDGPTVDAAQGDGRNTAASLLSSTQR
jgi:hypothetical protein